MSHDSVESRIVCETSVEHEEALLDSKGDSVSAVVYWSTEDPNEPGFAYRIKWNEGDREGHEESGPCDCANPWQDVYRFLGPNAAYSDGTHLPIAEENAMFRADGLDNPMSPNSGGVTWDKVEDACEESGAVERYYEEGGSFVVEWVDGESSSYPKSDPMAAFIAVRDMTAASR